MTLTLALSCFLIPLVCGAIIVLLWKENKRLKEEFKKVNIPKPIDVQIMELKELVTLESQCVLVASDKDSCSLFELITIPGTTRGFVLTLTAIAVWGCNLNRAKKSLTPSGSIQIVVPHCELLRFYEEPGSRKVIFEQNGVFARNSIDDVNKEVHRTLEKSREDILKDKKQQDLADQTLKLILSTIANSSGSTNTKVNIVFDDEAAVQDKPQNFATLAQNALTGGKMYVPLDNVEYGEWNIQNAPKSVIEFVVESEAEEAAEDMSEESDGGAVVEVYKAEAESPETQDTPEPTDNAVDSAPVEPTPAVRGKKAPKRFFVPIED